MFSYMSNDDIQEIFLSFPIAACILDANLHYIAVNEKFSAIVGATPSSLTGKPMAKYFPPEVVALAKRSFLQLADGQSVPDHEVSFNGKFHLVSVGLFPQRTNGPAKAISVGMLDISAIKEMEAKLAASNKELTAAYSRIETMAETDSLTGLSNRHGLDKFFDIEIRRAQRETIPISVLLIDADWFKPFNDAYGHLRGDECLKAIADVISGLIKRPDNCACRYGGEEFAVVLPNTDLADALNLGGKIREAIRGLQMIHKASPSGIVTVSIGVAGIDFVARDGAGDQIRDELLRSADLALYMIKAAGRDGVQALAISGCT